MILLIYIRAVIYTTGHQCNIIVFNCLEQRHLAPGREGEGLVNNTEESAKTGKREREREKTTEESAKTGKREREREKTRQSLRQKERQGAKTKTESNKTQDVDKRREQQAFHTHTPEREREGE